MMMSARSLSLCLILATAGIARCESPTTIEPFTLPDSAGKPWTLADGKPTVVVFIGTVCPINNAFLPTLAKLHADYATKGVSLVAINANPQDDAAKIAEHAKKFAVPFPVLKDSQQTVADRVSVLVVDDFEVVDVHTDNCQRLLVHTLALGESLFHHHVEPAGIR